MCALFSTDPTRSVGSGAGRALPAPAAPYSRCPRVKWVNPPVDRLIGLPRRDCGPQTRQRPSNALSSPRRQRWRCVCVCPGKWRSGRLPGSHSRIEFSSGNCAPGMGVQFCGFLFTPTQKITGAPWSVPPVWSKRELIYKYRIGGTKKNPPQGIVGW